MQQSPDKKFILAINTGSTSTKLALYEGAVERAADVVRHSKEEIGKFRTVWDQLELRTGIVSEWASKLGLGLSAVVATGGLLRPVEGGTYLVNERMLADARANLQGEHASNLGCAIAASVAVQYGCPAFVVDPVSVDEFSPLARYSGHPMIMRRSLSHALNIHAVVLLAAGRIGKKLTGTRFVVAHLGGGISVAPVAGGRIIDANDASSDGPFSPERTGGLPLQQFIGVCYSGKFSENEMRKMVMGDGGLTAYLGTNSAREVEERIQSGDAEAREVYEAMAYQVSKEIGAMAAVLGGKLDGVILTGGLAGSEMLVRWIRERVSFLGPVSLFPGEDEMVSLALGALRVLDGSEKAKEY